MNDRSSEGRYEWSDGTMTDYGFLNKSNRDPDTSVHPWANGEPNNDNADEDCVQLDGGRSYQWNDNDCSTQWYPLCNYPGIHTHLHFRIQCDLHIYKNNNVSFQIIQGIRVNLM